jgi:hypothetical protein
MREALEVGTLPLHGMTRSRSSTANAVSQIKHYNELTKNLCVPKPQLPEPSMGLAIYASEPWRL